MNSSIVLATVLTGALLLALSGLIAAASRHQKRAVRAPHLIGSMARVESDLRPEGSVIVGGELWRARLMHLEDDALRRGSSVRVVRASGHLLEVEPAD